MRKFLMTILVSVLFLSVTGCFGGNADDPAKDFDAERVIELANEMHDKMDIDFMVEVTDRSDVENDMLEMLTFLKNVEKVDFVVTADAMIMTIPYSVVFIKTTDGADIDAMKQEIIDNVDHAKWICAWSEIAYVTNYGSLIILIMAEQAEADKAYAALSSSVTGELGTRLQDVNDTL